MFDFIRYTPEYHDTWNDFVASSKNGTFLLDRNYMEYHADRFSDHSLLILKNGKTYALLPANADGQTLYSHQGLTYGGLITGSDASADGVRTLFSELNSLLRNEGFTKVVYKPTPWIYHRLPSEEDLYALINVCHASISVRNISSTIRLNRKLKWRRDRHYGANKATTNGLTIVQDDNAYDGFWQILTDNLMSTYGAKPVHTLHEIKLLHSRFPENIKLYTAWNGDRMVGGTLLYITSQTIHAQYISASQEGKKLHAVDLLFRHILGSQCDGYEYFDFGTSNEDGGRYLNTSLIYEKEGFGGRGVCYDTYEWELI